MSKGTSDKKDYMLDLPEMDEQKILTIAWIGTGRPTGVNVSAIRFGRGLKTARSE